MHPLDLGEGGPVQRFMHLSALRTIMELKNIIALQCAAEA